MKYLKINDAKYYISETVTVSDAQGDPRCDSKTATHTRNGKEKVKNTSNENFEQKLLSNWNLLIVTLTMNPRIDPKIVPIVTAPQTLLTSKTNKVVVDVACDDEWFNRTPWQVIRTGVDGSTTGEVCNDVSIESAPSTLLVGIVSTSPTCGLSRSLQVDKKRKYMSPGLGRNTQKLDAVIDGKFLDDLDSASILSKVICHKLSDSISGDLYLRCRTNFTNYPVQTQAPNFMDLGILYINTLNESSVLGNFASSIQNPTEIYHLSAPDNIFGEATAVGMSTITTKLILKFGQKIRNLSTKTF